MEDNIQHYTVFVETSSRSIWADVFAYTNDEAFNLFADIFPWIKSHTSNIVKCFVLEWEDNRPEETNVGVVQFHSEHIKLTLDR